MGYTPLQSTSFQSPSSFLTSNTFNKYKTLLLHFLSNALFRTPRIWKEFQKEPAVLQCPANRTVFLPSTQPNTWHSGGHKIILQLSYRVHLKGISKPPPAPDASQFVLNTLPFPFLSPAQFLHPSPAGRAPQPHSGSARRETRASCWGPAPALLPWLKTGDNGQLLEERQERNPAS